MVSLSVHTKAGNMLARLSIKEAQANPTDPDAVYAGIDAYCRLRAAKKPVTADEKRWYAGLSKKCPRCDKPVIRVEAGYSKGVVLFIHVEMGGWHNSPQPQVACAWTTEVAQRTRGNAEVLTCGRPGENEPQVKVTRAIGIQTGLESFGLKPDHLLSRPAPQRDGARRRSRGQGRQSRTQCLRRKQAHRTTGERPRAPRREGGMSMDSVSHTPYIAREPGVEGFTVLCDDCPWQQWRDNWTDATGAALKHQQETKEKKAEGRDA